MHLWELHLCYYILGLSKTHIGSTRMSIRRRCTIQRKQISSPQYRQIYLTEHIDVQKTATTIPNLPTISICHLDFNQSTTKQKVLIYREYKAELYINPYWKLNIYHIYSKNQMQTNIKIANLPLQCRNIGCQIFTLTNPMSNSEIHWKLIIREAIPKVIIMLEEKHLILYNIV